jgi:quercetin dioxygenase-like cupin family protein
MKSDEIEKGKLFIVVGVIEYIPHAVVSKTILKKATGTVSVVSFDADEGLPERISPFDTFIQIIDGSAEITIDTASTKMEIGEAIIIPAHTRSSLKANVRFKMISTLIKSGYEEVIT